MYNSDSLENTNYPAIKTALHGNIVEMLANER